MSDVHEPPFPADPPAQDTPETIRAHDWNVFSSVAEMKNHWDRPGWTPTRESYHWLIELGDELDLADVVRRLQKSLRSLEFDWVPQAWLHLTVQRLGWVDQTPRSAVDQAVAVARELLQGHPAFTVELGPLAGSPGALRLVTTPWRDLCAMYDRLLSARPSTAPGSTPPPSTAFRPHVGIGYSPRPRPAMPVIEAVRQLDPFPPLEVRITAVVLARLSRVPHSYQWEPVARIAFREDLSI